MIRLKLLLIAAAAIATSAHLIAAPPVFTPGIPVIPGTQYLLANWNFNAGGATDHPPLLAVSRGAGVITHNFVPENIQAFGGSTLNSYGGDPDGNALSLQAGTGNVNNGAHVTFRISMENFRNLALTYSTRGTGTGFISQEWSYSIDGASFTAHQMIIGRNVAAWSVQTVDFASVAALENAGTVFIRVVFNGATSALGNNRIENIQFVAAAIAGGVTDGSGTATIANTTPGTPFTTGPVVFESSQPQQMTVAVTGQDATIPLSSVSLTLPAAWSGLTQAGVSLQGAGFSGAGAGVSGNTVTVTGAGVTSGAIGAIVLSNITATGFANTDHGRFDLDISTALAGGALTPIVSQPMANLVIPIEMIRPVDASGAPLAAGRVVAVSGVGTVNWRLFSLARLTTYLQDETAGIALDNPHIGLFSGFSEGRRYTVIGTVSVFRGLARISVPDQAHLIDRGADVVPEPRTVTIAEALANAEALEGSIVRIRGAFRAEGSAPFASGANMTIGDASGGTLTLRISPDTDIPLNPEPLWPADVVGILNQFAPTTSAPFVGGYQILPRRAVDITPAAIADGFGVAGIVNVTPGSPYANISVGAFAPGVAQTISITVAGRDDTIGLASISATLPDGWPALSPGAVTLQGIGFAGAGASVSGRTVTVTGAAVTTWNTGTIILSNVTFPADITGADYGRFELAINTALAGGTLTPMFVQPSAFIVIPIDSIRPVDAQGLPVALGRTVAVEGVGTVNWMLFSQTRLSVFLQDATAGVSIDNPSIGGFFAGFTEGQRYLAVGRVVNSRGLTQIEVRDQQHLVNLGADVLPEPRTVTIAQLLAGPEALEGSLIRISGVSPAEGSPVFPGPNMTIRDASGGTLTLRISPDTDIGGNPEPAWPSDVVGIFGQFAPTSAAPFVGGYQILPRRTTDFTPTQVQVPPVNIWLNTHFSAAEQALPAIGGLSGDADGDGFANLLEYAFAGDPRSPSRAIAPALSAAGGFLQISFRRAAAAGDVRYAVEAGSDLSGVWAEIWNSDNDPFMGVGEFENKVVSDTLPLAGAGRRFLRLVVTLR